MRLRAMAKINLGLDVLHKREDGYHEVRMIMQTIQMYDLLDIRKKSEPGISLSTNLPYVPSDERNLVYKAAKILMDEFEIKEGLSMKLTKFIPVAAGMAGGSSDAAAAFVGVNRLFRLGLSEEELMKRAVQVGADVPYCVMRGTALAEGIGEKLTRLPGIPKCYILVGIRIFSHRFIPSLAASSASPGHINKKHICEILKTAQKIFFINCGFFL